MAKATHEKGTLPTERGGALDPPCALSDDELRFRASLEGLVDFYRVSQGGVLFRAFWPGALISLPLGGVLMAVALRGRFLLPGFEPALTLLAIAVIASAPLWAIFSLLRSMRRDDRYVAIFQTGLRIRLDASAEPREVPWEELLAVELSGPERLVLSTERGEIELRARFAELSLAELSRRIRDAKRLALWGRLTRPALLQT